MNVLSFSYCFPNPRSPTWGVFVQHRLAAMAQKVNVRVVSPAAWFPGTSWIRGEDGPREESWCGMTVYRPRFLCFPKVFKSCDGALYAASLNRWLDELVARWKPDLLDAHFVWPDGVGVYRLAERLRIPYSITLRGKIHPCLDIPSQRKQCAAALIRAETVISVDPRMAEIAADLGVPASRIDVVPNGIDLEHFQVGDRIAARLALGLPLEGRLIVTVAHLGQRKGHQETIQALKALPKDVRLMLVGGAGPMGGNGDDLRHLAERVGVAERLILIGKQPHERIPRFYQAADLTVLASWREGCPNTVLESLACGTPVVATDVGSVSCMIDEGINGRIVPVRDVQRLSAGIQAVLDQPPSAEVVCSSPAIRSWDAVAEDVLKVFSRIVSERPAAGVQNPTHQTSRQKLLKCT